MVATTFAMGVILVAMGVGGYLFTGGTLALLPAAIGVAFIILAQLSRRESMRMHAMHTTSLIAIIICVASSWRGLPKLLQGETKPAVVLTVALAVMMGAYVVMCVRSFVAARRRRAET
jgi:hypothetical protein